MPQIEMSADWTPAEPKKSPAPAAGYQALASRQIRKFIDRLATGVIKVGGLATIVAIFGIFVYLFIEVAPLLYSASVTMEGSARVGVADQKRALAQGLVTGVDEYMEIAYLLEGSRLSFYRAPTGDPIPFLPAELLESGEATAIARSGTKGHHFAVGTDQGLVVPVTIEFDVTFENGVRTIEPTVSTAPALQAVPEAEPIPRLAYQDTENGPVIVAVTDAGRLWLTKAQEAEGLFAEEEAQLAQVELTEIPQADITALLLDELGERLVVGSAAGELLYWDIEDPEATRLMGRYRTDESWGAVTALAYLIGDRSIVLGAEGGHVSVWMPYRDPDRGGDPELRHIRNFTPHAGAVTAISPSQRDKGFITADRTGGLAVHYSTSNQTVAQVPGDVAIRAVMFSPKTDGAVAVDDSGALHVYAIENEHPESTVAALFRPVLYEGYEEPTHMWQSSSGSDDFEAKLGMWPLIFGTLKGTIYAMLLATPLAVLGAIYTAMFMTPRLRSVVKPVVEIMAALPTVVLGFLAGLWFAPLLEKVFPGVPAAFLVLPIAILTAAVLWQFLPAWFTRCSGSWVELLGFVVVIIGSVWLCISLSDQINAWVFGGDYKSWLMNTFEVVYDQRNALVIAFAMGMAVIPTIFSISEDAISNVPRHLIAGSLAMGATPWQTLTRLVIVSASPGLFSALMIGLGRAVGETMIVLMATGNTPVTDMNLFNGFRTLSANIAVEMPEAPHGGTLYRLLFLSGLILFVFTTVVNTIAEVVRQRLRARYSGF